MLKIILMRCLMSSLSKFIWIQTIVIPLFALILYFIFPVAGNLDRSLIEHWMTPQGEFYLKGHWALAALGHQYVKWILIFCAVLVLGQFILSIKLKQSSMDRWRYGYFFVLLLIPGMLIGLLKSHAAHACPWDMTVNHATYFTWIFNATAGHCFPGGHASAGFSIMAGYFIYRDRNLTRAHFYLIAGIVLGFAMGWTQMMRGAHFLSHNLWTGLIIWTVNVMAYLLFYRKLNPSSALNHE